MFEAPLSHAQRRGRHRRRGNRLSIAQVIAAAANREKRVAKAEEEDATRLREEAEATRLKQQAETARIREEDEIKRKLESSSDEEEKTNVRYGAWEVRRRSESDKIDGKGSMKALLRFLSEVMGDVTLVCSAAVFSCLAVIFLFWMEWL